jgi:hypothetical protein
MDQQHEIGIEFKTLADLKAGEATKKAIEDALKATEGNVAVQAELKKQLDQVNAALASEAAEALKVEAAVAKATVAFNGLNEAQRKQQGTGGQDWVNKQREILNSSRNAKTQFSGAGGLPLADFLAQQEAAAQKAAKSGSFDAIVAKVREMKQEFRDAGGGMQGFFAVLFGSGAKVAMWGAAVAGGFAVAGKALSEFMQKQVEVAKLDAILAQNGLLTDKYREKLQRLSEAMEDQTAISSNEFLRAATNLTKFGADSSNIDRYMEAVKNLAGFLEGGVSEAAFLFGKAMQGSTEMLGRYGIKVDETLSQTEKLESIMRQAAEKGGGLLESRVETITGKWDLFKEAVGQVLFGLGALISATGIVQGTLYGLTRTLNWLGELFPTLVPKIEGMKNAMRRAKETMDEKQASAKRLTELTEKLGTAASEAAVKHDRLRESINRVAQAQAELVDANLARDLAVVEDQVKLFEQTGGKRGISPAEGARQKASLTNKADEDKFAAEQAARLAEVAADEKRLADLKAKAEAARAGVVRAAAAKRTREQLVQPKIDDEQQAKAEWVAAENELARLEADLATNKATGPTDLANKRGAIEAAKADVERLRNRSKQAQAARKAAEKRFETSGAGSTDTETAAAVAKEAQDAFDKARKELEPRIETGRQNAAVKQAARNLKAPAEAIGNFADIAGKMREELKRIREASTDAGRTEAGAAPLSSRQFGDVTKRGNAAAELLSAMEQLRAKLPQLSQDSKNSPAKAKELAAALQQMEQLQLRAAVILSELGKVVSPGPVNPTAPRTGPSAAPPPARPTAPTAGPADSRQTGVKSLEDATTVASTASREVGQAANSAAIALAALAQNSAGTTTAIVKKLGEIADQQRVQARQIEEIRLS